MSRPEVTFEETLEKLGLAEYTHKFIAEGFDSWKTLSDIKESDLNQLGVKLGHRRKLQRHIAESGHESKIEGSAFKSAGTSVEQSPENFHRLHSSHESSSRSLDSGTNAPRTKRRYKRHAKADPHAPERPLSAYVLFSNQMRLELKSLDLGFTEIAKAVGVKWQDLPGDERAKYESEAAAQKAKYHEELAAYKKTDNYNQYEVYLAEFKARERGDKGDAPGDAKKTKLHHETSNESHESNFSKMSESYSPDRRESATSPCSIESTTSEGNTHEYRSKTSTPATAHFVSATSSSSSRELHYASPTSANIPRPPSSDSQGQRYRSMSYGTTYGTMEPSAPPGYAPFATNAAIAVAVPGGQYGRSPEQYSPTSPPGLSAMSLNGVKSERTLPPLIPPSSRLHAYGAVPLVSMPPSRALVTVPPSHRLNELVEVATNEISRNEGR